MRDVAQYVGVAATSRCDEVARLLAILDMLAWLVRVKLVNGPLVSRKTLHGLQPDNPAQYPRLDQVAHPLIDDPRLYDQMSDISSRMLAGDGRLDGFQLNILWSAIDQLRRSSERSQIFKLILQPSRASLESVNGI